MEKVINLLMPLTRSNDPVCAVPTYVQGEQEDEIDLQVKALIYMFKSCDIPNQRSLFSSSNSPTKTHTPLTEISPGSKDNCQVSETAGSQKQNSSEIAHHHSTDEKLDRIYNKQGFEQLLISDPHRIFIDWKKNKFRSLCILSGHPHAVRLPTFSQPSYRFHVLPPDAADSCYVDVLSQSEIYIEHSIPQDFKRELASEIVAKLHIETGKAVFNKDERYVIIKRFLRGLAFEVQVQRIYKALLKERVISSPSGVFEVPPVSSSVPPSPERRSFIEPKVGERVTDRSPEKSPDRLSLRSRQQSTGQASQRSQTSLQPLPFSLATAGSSPTRGPRSPVKMVLNDETMLPDFPSGKTLSSRSSRSSLSSAYSAITSPKEKKNVQLSASPQRSLKKKSSMYMRKSENMRASLSTTSTSEEFPGVCKSVTEEVWNEAITCVTNRLDKERKIVRNENSRVGI